MRFVLVDRIVELDAAKHITAEKRIASDEDYFADHFPGILSSPECCWWK